MGASRAAWKSTLHAGAWGHPESAPGSSPGSGSNSFHCSVQAHISRGQRPVALQGGGEESFDSSSSLSLFQVNKCSHFFQLKNISFCGYHPKNNK